MKKAAFIVIAMLALLLISNTAVLAAGASDNAQKVVVPSAAHGKNKIVIPHGDLVQVVYIRWKDDAMTSTSNPTLVDDGAWGGPSSGYRNGYDIANWHWLLSKPENQRGVKYVINPSGSGVLQTDVVTAIKNSFNAWSAVGPKTPKGSALYTYGGISTTAHHSDSIDGQNVVSWGSVVDDQGKPDTIVAISYMWYSTSNHGLLDCDTVFNTYFTWSAKGDSTSSYDIWDIGTHEFGHWTGLNDIYDGSYTPMTMYGYAWQGETYKRSLEKGDIDGVHVAYKMK